MSDSSEPLDFCSAGLCSAAVTSSVCSDGFEPTNLLRPGGAGFLAAGFVRPPVSVTLTFCCPVVLQRVTVGLRLGQQLTTGLEVAVSAQEHGDGGSQWSRAGSLWQTAGRQPRDGVTFVNRTVVRVVPADVDYSLPLKVKQDPSLLRRVRRVRLKLTRAHGASALCLRSVEAWAMPADSENAVFMKVMRERQTNSTRNHSLVQTAKGIGNNGGTSSVSDKKPSASDGAKPESMRARLERAAVRPPDEFLDAITCEVMLLPMVLPSGHTVDQSTLERHHRAEAGWGRPPSDPFSGVAFTNGKTPVPDAALKARIDHFLFLHAGDSAELAAVGRTVGKRAAVAAKRLAPAPPAPELSQKRPAADRPVLNGGGGGASTAGGGGLEGALRAALAGLTTFRPDTAQKRTDTDASEAAVCGTCGAAAAAQRPLYSLPCSHALCRQCLLPLPSDAQCGKCRAKFNKRNATRLHC